MSCKVSAKTLHNKNKYYKSKMTYKVQRTVSINALGLTVVVTEAVCEYSKLPLPFSPYSFSFRYLKKKCVYTICDKGLLLFNREQRCPIKLLCRIIHSVARLLSCCHVVLWMHHSEMVHLFLQWLKWSEYFLFLPFTTKHNFPTNFSGINR